MLTLLKKLWKPIGLLAAGLSDHLFAFFRKAAEWLLDKWVGDSVFKWVREVTAPYLSPEWQQWLLEYGVRGFIIFSAFWLFWKAGRSKALAPVNYPSREDGFREGTTPIPGGGWANLLDLADELRRDLAGSIAGDHFADGLSRHEELSGYAGLLNEVATMYGVRPPSLRSEPIMMKGRSIIFRVNGSQMDSIDESGAELYRFVHIWADEAPEAKAKAAAVLIDRIGSAPTE